MRSESEDNGGVGVLAPEQEAAADAKAAAREPASETPPAARLASVDALRGFDMFWIIGGREALLAFVALFVTPVPAWLDYQLEHPPWDHFTFTAWDLIMPLFLFVSGVSLPFSMSKWRSPDGSLRGFYFRLARRLALLWILGMAIQGNLLDWNLEKLRLYSNTLQAIAAGYLIATVFMLALSIRGQAVATAALLVGFWLLMEFAPYPGKADAPYGPWNNFAKYIDTLVLGRFVDKWHYTWVLSSMGFGATVMMGVFAGYVLRSRRSEGERLARLVALAAGCLAAGWVWSYWFPFNKYIWSGSMNLWACGWCFALLAAFYFVIDMRGYRRWAFPLVVIGTNAIAVYAATHLFDFKIITNIFIGKLTPRWGDFGAFVTVAVTLLIPWLILLYLYRKRTFIRL